MSSTRAATATETPDRPPAAAESLEIELRDPSLAALLAWLLPGAGHFYQRRYPKAILFAVCILGTYFFGLALGEGKVVYAAWNRVDRRWQYPLQLGVGLPAAPALVQNMLVRRGREPILGGFMAPPREYEDENRQRRSELSDWHRDLNVRFELGTLYTMIAGLLNILAIWDAYAGPVIAEPGKPERGPPGEPAGDDAKRKD